MKPLRAWYWTVLGLLSLFLLPHSSHAQISIPPTGDIATVAGNGTAGYSGDGGAATSAELNYPNGLAVDASGNVYIADASNNVIREINASTGDISTVAGTGTGGYSGDGGAATSAKLLFPTAVAVDSSGNLYIADTDNSRVRKVTASTGDISTIAGDGTAGSGGDGYLAVDAKLNLPWGVAVDSIGNVYIADYENNYVRVVRYTNQYIYAFAGYQYTATIQHPGGYSGNDVSATSAELYAPMGLAMDSSGNLYIADSANQRIRAVYASGTIPNVSSPTAGYIYTVAGDGTGGFSGDGSVATSAELYEPEAVAVDSSGNIDIADRDNERVREVTASTGDISTVAGDGTSGYSGDGGATTSAKLHNPQGVTVDSSGDLFIGDSGNNRVRVVGP